MKDQQDSGLPNMLKLALMFIVMIEITFVEHIVDIPEYALVFESQCSNHAEKHWLLK